MTLKDKEKEMRIILSRVAKQYGLQPHNIMERRKHADIIEPRQVSMYLMVEARFKVNEIGRFFKRNHATVIYSHSKISIELTVYEHISRIVKNVQNQNWIKNKYYEKNPFKFCLPCVFSLNLQPISN